MGTSLRLVDGAVEVVLRPSAPSYTDAIYVQNYDLGFPALREVVQDNAGQSGTLDLTEFHGSKVVTVEATVVDDETLTRHEWMDILKILCHPARRPYLYVLQDGWTAERRMSLRANSLSCVIDKTGATALKVSLAWTVPSGLMEATEATEYRLRPSGTNAGLAHPVSWGVAGVSFTPANSASVITIENEGTGTTPPIYRLFGAMTGPRIRNASTGEVLSMPDLTIPAGHYLEVDVANRTAYLDSTPSLNYYRYIDWSESTWWEFRPGETLLTLSTASQDSNAELLTVVRERWL